MPILCAEPSLYPEDVFDAAPPATAGQWWVMHTKPRQEKALARQLCELKVAFFLPLNRKRSRIRKKIVSTYLPLFPGYLFLFAATEQLQMALATRRVANHLPVTDQQQLWGELRQVHRLLETGLPVSPIFALVPGAKVEMRSGPLVGLRGVIEKSVSGNRFIVQVNFIQQGASVLIEEHMLECVRD